MRQDTDGEQNPRLHYTEVLSMSDGRLVAFNGMDGVYKTADALVGPGVTTLALTFVGDACKKMIFEKYPALAEPRVKTAIDTALVEYELLTRGDAVPHGSQTQEQRDAASKILLACMDRHVKPLMPEEYMTLDHAGQRVVAGMQSAGGVGGEGYAAHLVNIMRGKKAIVVEL